MYLKVSVLDQHRSTTLNTSPTCCAQMADWLVKLTRPKLKHHTHLKIVVK